MTASTELNRNTQPRQGSLGKARISLGIKLPLIVLLLLALAFLVSTILSIRATQEALIDILAVDLRLQAEDKAEIIRAQLNLSKSAALDLAAAAEVIRYNRSDIQNIIRSAVTRNEQVVGASISYEIDMFREDVSFWSPAFYEQTNADGFPETVYVEDNNGDYLKTSWYTAAKERNAPVLQFTERVTEREVFLLMRWSVPMYTPGAEFRGVVTTDIPISQAQQIINQIKVGEKGYAFLLNSQGVIVGISSEGGSYQSMQNSMLLIARASQNREWEAIVNQMISGNSGFTSATDLQGRRVYVTYLPVGSETGWSLGLAYPEEELLATASQSQNTLVIYSSLVALVFGAIIYLFTLPITQPLQQLTEYAKSLSTSNLQTVEGKLAAPIQIKTRDEIEELANAFNQMAQNLAASFESLEDKVKARTADLERNALEFATIAEVARDITIVRDVDTLLNVSANLIRERFNYYHVGIFLVDDRGEYAVLRAASSVGAQQMLENNYRLKVGQEGMVGLVTRTGRAHIALDIGADAVHFQNPYLPDTHSEITLPLRIHSVTIGALDIQTTVQSAFDERDLKVLQLLADQIAAAIQNAQLAEQLSQSLAQIKEVNARQTQIAWQTAISERERPAYEYDGFQIKPIPAGLPQDLINRLEEGKPVIAKENNSKKKTLMVPLQVLNQTIGVIGLEKDNPAEQWTEDDIAVVTAAANRAALTLENTRLLEESQRRAVKERAIFESTGKVGSALNIETILQTTVEEIERILNSKEVTLQFINDKKS